MDKEYILRVLRDRIDTLHNRYRLLCHGKDEFGNELKAGVASTYRANTRRELRTCMLIEELITAVPGKDIYLSEDAIIMMEQLIEPIERHRRLKEIDNVPV